jgi:hypothetical protein
MAAAAGSSTALSATAVLEETGSTRALAAEGSGNVVLTGCASTDALYDPFCFMHVTDFEPYGGHLSTCEEYGSFWCGYVGIFAHTGRDILYVNIFCS